MVISIIFIYLKFFSFSQVSVLGGGEGVLLYRFEFLMYPCAVQTGTEAKTTHPFLVTLPSLDLPFLSSRIMCLDVPWAPQMDMSKMEFLTPTPN